MISIPWRLVCTILFLLAGVVPAAAAELPSTVAKGARLVEVFSSAAFHEGPTWDPATGKLYFTAFFGGDPGNQQIIRLDGPGKGFVWLDKSEGVNGTWLSLDGRLLGAQAYGHRLMSYSFGPKGPGDARALAVNMKWHQPNDVCQTPNGNIYFTDPDFANKKTSKVYVMTSDRKIRLIIQDMPLPNGVIASNDGKVLYVGDSERKMWRSYPIKADGTTGAGKDFFDPGTKNMSSPDGMTIDANGNLYFTGRGGVWVASRAGKPVGFIPTKEFCANVTFGGADGKTLYLTCNTKVYSLAMTVSGGEHAVRAKRKAAKKKPKEFKATCPVLGEPAAQDAMVMYRGKKLYFCCQSCPDIFNVTPNVYSTAVHLQWFQTEQIAQVACPLKGHGLDDVLSVAVEVGGVKVKVCCAGCAKKLKLLKGDKKVAAVFAKLDKGFTVQTKCPVSGKAIDPIYEATYQKQKIWFCCPKCHKAFLANPKKYIAKLPQLKTAKKK